ncbi:MAG: hypothetical protein RSC31_04340 [Anaerovoracaceae bacterium]
MGMTIEKYNCVDLGTGNCPCILATCQSCIQCAKLRGKTCNECNWQGVCVYNEFLQNHRTIKTQRNEFVASIIERKIYTENFQVLVLEVGKAFAQKAKKVGGFVFLRSCGKAKEYDMPISILKTDYNKGQIHVGINRCGPKTETLLGEASSVVVRGVYENGLIGIGNLYKNPEATVIIAKGIAIAPLGNMVEQLCGQNGNILAYIDTDKVTQDFIKDYFGWLPAKGTFFADFTQNQDRLKVIAMESKKEGMNLFALASPYYTNMIKAINPKLVYPNHSNMCCGEGVCGACSIVDGKGNTVKMCKSEVITSLDISS